MVSDKKIHRILQLKDKGLQLYKQNPFDREIFHFHHIYQNYTLAFNSQYHTQECQIVHHILVLLVYHENA